MATPEVVQALGPDVDAFFQYWWGLPKEGHVPHLSDYLDHAPPDLQPNVVLTDVSSATDMSIRLTGTALAAMVGEMTGSHAERIYQGEAREKAIKTGWCAANHPCGYTVARRVRSKSGLMFVSKGVVLPLRTNTPGSKTLAGYNQLPKEDTAIAQEGQIQAVQEFGDSTWVDIGAGVPD